MEQAIPNTPQTGPAGELTLSSPDSNAVTVEIATFQQMMQTLLSRVDALQQNQAIQLAGVHDRLDAVELELPLIQEQSALRIRDLEARMSMEIDQATLSAEAVHQEVAGKLNSLAARMETQRDELNQMRESKRLSESRLNQAILDIEQLCGTLEQRPAASPYRSRINEHIRKAALDLAPAAGFAGTAPVAKDRQAAAGAGSERPISAGTAVSRPIMAAAPGPPLNQTAELSVPAAPAASSTPVGNPVPGFDSWKRQFMEDGDPQISTRTVETDGPGPIVVCPRCYSDRTRPSTLNRWDHLYRLAKLFPHRCRSCSHRFYKRAAAGSTAPDDEPAEAIETR